MLDPGRRPQWRWVILVLGILAQAATCVFLYGLPTLVPALRADEHLSLLGASVVVVAPTAGLLLTLIAWGAAADRFGERVVIATGLALATAFLALTTVTHGPVVLCVLLALAGAGGASVNAASGRVVMGWFTVDERGLAMGARQTAQPLGVALAALTLPPLAHGPGVHAALLFAAGCCAVMALLVAVLVTDPPRPDRKAAERTGSPYRETILWRIHGASALLVVPQFAVSAFTLVYLVSERHWDPTAAGRLVFAFQLAGALGRVAAGVWSDAVRSRLVPMRQLAITSSALMTVLALGAWAHGWWVMVGFALGAVVTVADNGLAFTAVAEIAGMSWAGRALGVQNTGQNVAALLTPPLLAAVIGDSRYAIGFAVVAILPLLAVPLIPVRAEASAAAARAIPAPARAAPSR
jgi:sugar phosphate permease